MLRVGLTGPAGSGKSTVARLFAAHGWPVIDADRVAHELYVPGSAIIRELARAFGSEVVAPDGTVDRGALGRQVFQRSDAREMLNRIVHPPLLDALKKRLLELENTGSRIAVLEAALLLQWDTEGLVDVVVGVWATRDLRLKRLVGSGLTRDAAALRADVQVSEEKLRDRADTLIENNGSTSELERAVRRVIDDLERRATSD